jgi:hypothetical protein
MGNKKEVEETFSIEKAQEQITEIDAQLVKVAEVRKNALDEKRRLEGSLKVAKADSVIKVKENLSNAFDSKGAKELIDGVFTMEMRSIKTLQLEESIDKIDAVLSWCDTRKREFDSEKSNLVNAITEKVISDLIQAEFKVGQKFFDGYEVLRKIVEEAKELGMRLSSLDPNWTVRTIKIGTPPELKPPSDLVRRFMDSFRNAAVMDRTSVLTILERFERDLEYPQYRPQVEPIRIATVRQERSVIEA